MRKILVLGLLMAVTAAAWALPYPSGYVTNMVIQTIGENTNTIIVAGAGTATANGTYSLKNANIPSAGFYIYTNANGLSGFIRDPNLDFSDTYAITNSSGVELYFSSDPPGGVYSKSAGGANPVPTVNFGYSTNSFTYFVALPYQLPMPIVQSNILYVSTNGNDYSAIKGRPDFPWRHVYRAVTNAAISDVVFINPGWYEEKDWPVNFAIPKGVVIKGSGMDVTYIHGKDGVSGFNVYLGTSNVVCDLTSTNLIYYGGLLNATNISLLRVRAAADGDVVVAQGSSYGIFIEDCDFSGNSDKIADLSSQIAADTQLTNYFITVKNTWLRGGGGADGDGLNILGGSLRKKLMGVYVDVGSGFKEIGSTTNFGTTLPGFTKRPATVRTNFIDGQLYTNVYSVDIDVSQTFSNAVPVAGKIQRQLWVFAQGAATITGTTNRAGDLYSQSPITNHISLSATVPSQYVYCFTNPLLTTADSKTSPGSGQLNIR